MSCENCKNCLGNCGITNNNMINNDIVNKKELPKIIGGFLNLTQSCNLKCVYCFVIQQPKQMSYQVAKDTSDFFAKNAKETNQEPSINFFGGEPLLRWDDIIVPLTTYIRKEYGDKFRLSLTTNGILLDEEKLEFMKTNKIGFLFSIDGDKKTQDKNRPYHNGKGSFDDLIKKIPMFLKYNPNATFRSTINNDNVYDMTDNYKFAIDMGYNNVFMIPNVFIEWTKEQRQELNNQLSKIADVYIENYRNNKIVQFNQFSEANSKIKQINEINKTNRYRDIGINIPAYGRCGIGGTKFASVGMSGKLYSCQELVENPNLGEYFEIGNIYDGVDDNKRWNIINKFDPKNIIRSDGKTCRNCSMNKICNGGCLINNYLATGDMEIMPSILCDFFQECINQQIRILKEISKDMTKVSAFQ
jgi:radical SAM protein with 4Fe4S-binding SPASM domain